MIDFLDAVLAAYPVDAPPGARLALKATNPDLTTRDGFRWAAPPDMTTDPHALANPTLEVCPQRAGDGLSVAKTAKGMAQGGYSPATLLIVAVDPANIIAEDTDKLKVVQARSLALVDGLAVIRRYGAGLDLTDAILTNADLRGANLRGAVLTDAILTDAILTGADLTGAILSGADLRMIGYASEALAESKGELDGKR